jgi:DNA-binding transcriptional LysR family regulator
MTAPSSFARGPLTDWLITYRKRYPLVDLELIQSNDYLDFQEHQLDFAFRQGPLPNSTLVAKRMFSIHWGVFVAPSLLSETGEIESSAALVDYPIISAGVQRNSLPWRFKSSVWQPSKAAMLFGDTGQCLQAAKAGLGFTYASRYEATPYLEAGDLVEVLVNERSEPADFYMVLPNRTHRSVKSETFIEHIAEEIIRFGEPDGLSF